MSRRTTLAIGTVALVLLLVSALCGCGSSGPVAMDPQTESEYAAAQSDLKRIAADTMVLAQWTEKALKSMDRSGGLAPKQKQQLGAAIPQAEQISGDSRIAAGFMGAAALTYHIPETEYQLANACFSTVDAFRPVAEALLNETMPTPNVVAKFKDASAKVQSLSSSLGYSTN